MKESPETSEQNLSAHLLELRGRLLKIIVVLVLVSAALTPFLPELVSIFTEPMLKALPRGNTLSMTGVLEGVIVPLKILLTTAFVLSLPFSLWEVWSFVAPGLYAREKRLILPLVLASLVLFLLGLIFCYFVFFPMLFALASAFTPKNIALYIPTMENYLSFILTMFVVFGLAFQLPIAMFGAYKMTLVSTPQLKNWRGYAVIAAFAIAAVVTPPDIVSQFFLAVPLVVLYQLGLWTCQLSSIINKSTREKIMPSEKRAKE